MMTATHSDHPSVFSSDRPIETLEIQPSLKEKLIQNGILKLKDLNGMGVSDLCRETNLSPQEAMNVLKIIRKATIQAAANHNNNHNDDHSLNVVNNKKNSGKSSSSLLFRNIYSSTTALDVLRREEQSLSISTHCRALDSLFKGGNGFPTEQIIEIYGQPGSGKTQLAIQLAINSQLPPEFGGIDSECLYIDTEGSFTPIRALQLANGAVYHARYVDHDAIFDPYQLLDGIKYIRIHDHIQLIAVINMLEEFLRETPRMKLIIIDSIAFHFRHSFVDMGLRSRILSNIGLILKKLCTIYHATIIIINQVTSSSSTTGLPSELRSMTPALGETWGHICHHRVAIFHMDGERYATLIKSSNMPQNTVRYVITEKGHGDVENIHHQESLQQQQYNLKRNLPVDEEERATAIEAELILMRNESHKKRVVYLQ